VYQPRYRVLNHQEQRITVAVPDLMTEQFLTERNSISHDVITDVSQFITERFGCKACICLSIFSVIVPSESLIVSATQMRRFGKCPAQIPITVFRVAMPFTFAVRQPLDWLNEPMNSLHP
jgi:hypothetical protein